MRRNLVDYVQGCAARGVISWDREEKRNLMDYVQMAGDGEAVWAEVRFR
jgi:DNA primase catalytic subunit